MTPTDEIKARLDELGVEYVDSTLGTIFWGKSEYEQYCDGHTRLIVIDATPEQAIAATVGMEKWEPSKEWKAWHNSLKHDNPTSIIEAVENILYEAIDFGGDMGPNGNVWSGVDEGTVLTENCIDGWVESIESIAATMGAELTTVEAIRKLLDKLNTELCNAGCVIECETREERQRLIDAIKDKYAQAIVATECRSCASCPEMGNPDSYISHLQSALKWHDEHVPRPTNPRSTCVVLKGQKPPEEVLFVRDEGGVTHYLPEDAGTCKDLGGTDSNGEDVFNCSECGCVLSLYDGEGVNTLCTSFIYDYPRFCPECGRRIIEEEAE